MAAVRAGRLVEENKLVTYRKWVYRWPTARAEVKLAQWTAALLQRGTLPVEDRLPQKLSAVEKKLGMVLNDQQRTAVLTAIRSPGDYPHRRSRHGQNLDPKGFAGPV